jgi:hypothetical protein
MLYRRHRIFSRQAEFVLSLLPRNERLAVVPTDCGIDLLRIFQIPNALPQTHDFGGNLPNWVLRISFFALTHL